MSRFLVRERALTATSLSGRPPRSDEQPAVLGQQLDDAGADGAEAGDADLEGCSHGSA